MGKTRNQTTTQQNTIDPRTQAALDAYRSAATQMYQQSQQPSPFGQDYARNLGFGLQTGLGGIEDYFDPYQNQVIAGTQGDFDRQRGLASRSAADMATKEGAFGGSRSAVLEANLTGDVNRNEASTLAGLRSTGYNNAAAQLLADRGRAAELGFQGMQFDANQRQGGLLALLAGLPFGNSTSTTSEPYHDDIFSKLLGLGGLILSAKNAFGKKNQGFSQPGQQINWNPNGGYSGPGYVPPPGRL